jgi:hypothetical protein
VIGAIIAKCRARFWLARAKHNSAEELVQKRRHRIAVVEGMQSDAEHARPNGPSKPIEIHIERWYVPTSWSKLCLKHKKCYGWELFSDQNSANGEKRRVYLLDNGKFATDMRLRSQPWFSHAHPTRMFNPWVCVQWDMSDLDWLAIEAAATKLKSFTND